MREIKFRAWDNGIMKKFIRIPFFVGSDGTPYKDNDPYGLDMSGRRSISPLQDIVIMQYTGLKDKDGKEIYEGDIIADPDNFGCTTGWGGGEYDECPNKKLIVWDEVDAKFKLDFINEKYRGRGVSGFSLCKGNCASRFEVIGNIYENPELLKP